MKFVVYLQKIGNINKTILKNLKKDLKEHFRKYVNSVIILPEKMELKESYYVPSERQYNGYTIFKNLKDNNKKAKHSSTLGILDVDIFKKKLNFIFGVATNPEHPLKDYPGSAIVSVARLRETFYSRDERNDLIRNRVLKEAVHEIGHTFGLKHCENKCVMQFSETISYVDNKPLQFCNDCTEILENFTNRN